MTARAFLRLRVIISIALLPFMPSSPGRAAGDETYTIKIKSFPDVGKPVVYHVTGSEKGTAKGTGPDGKTNEKRSAKAEEQISVKAVLVRGDHRPRKYRWVTEKAVVVEDGKASAKPYQGRTTLYELRDGKYHLTVEGKPDLPRDELDRLTKGANDRTQADADALFLAPRPVKVGESWAIDVRVLARAMDLEGLIDPAGTRGRARLVKVYAKDGKRYGVIEATVQLAVTGKDELTFDPPGRIEGRATLEAVIDGSSTAATRTGTWKFTGKGTWQEKGQKATVEFNMEEIVEREQRFAEGERPAIKEVLPRAKVEPFGAWKEFAKVGRFSARFPEAPGETFSKDAAGNVTHTFTLVAEGGSLVYTVLYRDHSTGGWPLGQQETLDLVADNMKNAKSKKDVKLGDVPGRDFLLDVKQGKDTFAVISRVYVTKRRLYQIYMVAEKTKYDPAVAAKFLDSLQLLERKTRPGEPAFEVEKLGGRVEFDETSPDGQVVQVSLSGTKTTDANLAHLKGLTKLRSLDLSGTQVTDAGLVHVEGLTELRELRLNVKGPGLKHLEKLKQLEHLYLGATLVSDGDLASLRGLTNLRELFLGAARINGSGLEHLKGMTRLQVLDLNSTSITNDSLANLEGLKDLRSLNLSFTSVGDTGLKHLKGLTSLRFLDLYYTPVTDAGLAHLAGLRNLEDLKLLHTRLAGPGLVHLKGLSALHKLNLTDTHVNDEGLVHLKDLVQLRWLSLGGTRVTDAGLAHLAGLVRLETLLLNELQVSDAGLAHLRKLRRLTTVSLGSWDVTDAGLAHLKDMTGLQSLTLFRAAVTDAGLEWIKGFDQLNWLNLADTLVTDAGLARLSSLARLRTLIVAGPEVTEAGVRKLKQALPAVHVNRDPRGRDERKTLALLERKSFTLRRDAEGWVTSASAPIRIPVADADLASLKGFPRLQKLELREVGTTDAGLAHLKEAAALEELRLNGNPITDAGLKHLEGLTKLRKLELSETRITDAGLDHLKGLAKLQELRLSDTMVTPEGVARLQGALPKCKITR